MRRDASTTTVQWLVHTTTITNSPPLSQPLPLFLLLDSIAAYGILQDEEEIAERERRRATARQHWACIRRYVQDRIKQRRNKKMGFNQDKAFKRLRAQAKASMNPEQARRELYEK